MRGQTAIAGLGMTEMGKVYGRTATDFAAEALALALDDAGLVKADVDGLLSTPTTRPRWRRCCRCRSASRTSRSSTR